MTKIHSCKTNIGTTACATIIIAGTVYVKNGAHAGLLY